ncbi:GAF domain-containing protein [candidate division KSB1 bacterium]|nr:GAF domain-containing protein [candidate division KSB1 bacterium]
MSRRMTRTEKYSWAAKKVRAQVLRHMDTVATLANAAAILQEYFDFFWIGFYFNKTDFLLLGPFQGPPACVKLQMDRGVCAECVKVKQTIIVADVSKFPGHVDCDERSKSEIAVPVFNAQKQVSVVLDVDSDQLNHFDQTDREGLEKIAELLGSIFK